jgi:hypothetical protein
MPVIAMLATLVGSAPGILEFLQSLSPGTVVAQLEDGTIAVCQDVEEADRRILASRGDYRRANARHKRDAEIPHSCKGRSSASVAGMIAAGGCQQSRRFQG